MFGSSVSPNFLSVLGTPVGDTAPPEGLSDVAGAAVDTLYEIFDDQYTNIARENGVAIVIGDKVYIATGDNIAQSGLSLHAA